MAQSTSEIQSHKDTRELNQGSLLLVAVFGAVVPFNVVVVVVASGFVTIRDLHHKFHLNVPSLVAVEDKETYKGTGQHTIAAWLP